MKFVLLLLLFFLVSCGPAPLPPLPQPTREYEQTQIYYPFFSYDPCHIRRQKGGLAYSYPAGQLAAIVDDLCLNQAGVIRTWSVTIRPSWALGMNYIPVLWGPGQLVAFRLNIPRDYNGVILVGNECDQPDQCNTTPAELATLYADAQSWCANCTFTTPGLASDETDGQWLRSWLLAFLAQGGEIDRIVGIDSHHYIAREHAIAAYTIWGNGSCGDDRCLIMWELNRRLNTLRAVLPGLPLVVSEIGGCSDWPYVQEWMDAQLDFLETRDDVEWYAVFIDNEYHPEWQPCAFPIYTGGALNEYGQGIRGGVQVAGNEAYP